MTADQAAQSVNYWQNEAQNIQAGNETSEPVTAVFFPRFADSQGNLLANNNYPAEAGQAYQTALAIWPGSVEAITGLTRVLAQQGQFDQAGQALGTRFSGNITRIKAKSWVIFGRACWRDRVMGFFS